MEYYLTIKMNEVLIYATPRMTLENFMLSEQEARHKRPHIVDSIYMKYPE